MSSVARKTGQPNKNLENVKSIMKTILPSDFSVNEQALEAMNRCVMEFISSIGCEAASRTVHDGRTTMTANDIITSLHNVGFDDYYDALEIYVRKTRFDKTAAGVIPQIALAEIVKKEKTKKPKYVHPQSNVSNNSQMPIPVKTTTQSSNGAPLATETLPTASATTAIPLPTNTNLNTMPISSQPHTSTPPVTNTTVEMMDPVLLQRLNQAMVFAREHPNCDQQALAAQVPVSFNYFREKLDL